MLKLQKNSSIEQQFNNELRFEYVSEIVNEERVLKEFKHLYIKNAFNSVGSRMKEFYELQYQYVQRLKKEYAVKYAS